MLAGIGELEVDGEGAVDGRVIGEVANDVVDGGEVRGFVGVGSCEGEWAFEVQAVAWVVCVYAVYIEGTTGSNCWEDVRCIPSTFKRGVMVCADGAGCSVWIGRGMCVGHIATDQGYA